jgi:hypothetical protein
MFLRDVHDVEYASGVEDASRGSAGSMRVGTRIAHIARGFHRVFCEVCGSGGKLGRLKWGRVPVFQLSGDAQARFRNLGWW